MSMRMTFMLVVAVMIGSTACSGEPPVADDGGGPEPGRDAGSADAGGDGGGGAEMDGGHPMRPMPVPMETVTSVESCEHTSSGGAPVVTVTAPASVEQA